MRIEAKANIILVVPNPCGKEAEDILLEAEQHVNEQAMVFDITGKGGCGKVGVRLHIDGKKGSIRVYQN